MPQTIDHYKIEEVENYLIEIDEAEETLRLLANLCQQQTSTEFMDSAILKYIGDYLHHHLDRTISIRHYFLKLDIGNRIREFGIAGEVHKQQLKHPLSQDPP